MSTLGNNIKRLRSRERLTQEELSRQLHVNRATLANWEVGRTDPDHSALCQLADFFEVSVDYLLGRVPPSSDGLPRWERPVPVRGKVERIKSLDEFKEYIRIKYGPEFVPTLHAVNRSHLHRGER